MLNYLLSIKEAFTQRFGTVLGYVLLVLSALVAITILGLLIKTFFKVAIGILIICCALFGIYKLSEVIKTKSNK